MTPSWMVVLTITNASLVLLFGLALAFLYRRWGETVLRGADGISAHHGLRLGTRVPELVKPDGTVSFAPRGQFVIFGSADCSICEEASWAYRDFLVLQDHWTLAYVVDGKEGTLPPEPLREFFGREQFVLLTDEHRRIHEEYQVQVNPFVLVVNDEGEVAAKGLASRVSDLIGLAIRAGDQSLVELQEDVREGRVWVDRSEDSGDLMVRRSLAVLKGRVGS